MKNGLLISPTFKLLKDGYIWQFYRFILEKGGRLVMRFNTRL